MLRGDLVGSIPGVVRVSGEVAKEGSGGAEGVRVFESTARGQFGWPQELCLDARNSEGPLARLRQVCGWWCGWSWWCGDECATKTTTTYIQTPTCTHPHVHSIPRTPPPLR